MSGGVLLEAYQRFHRTGPEWGTDQLTNHGPMAVEVLVRRGHDDAVGGWVDRYVKRLDEMPGPASEITDANWPDALGDGRRTGDWGSYFTRQLAERSWGDVLRSWWPRLLPGIAAGATHGVIRTGHVVRVLLAGGETEPTLGELAHALAFWAARAQPVPAASAPAGTLGPQAALAAVPRIPDQHGPLAGRFWQLAGLGSWPVALAGLRPPVSPADTADLLTELVAAATLGYLRYGHGQPVLLVHAATAPNAVLHSLPALPPELAGPSLAAVWAAAAAVTAAYAPPGAAAAPRRAGSRRAEPLDGPDAVACLLDRAVAHGDEHVIKFADPAAEVYTRTGNRDALAAALHAAALIQPPGKRTGS